MNWNRTIFLAHASEDKVFARKLYKSLKVKNLEPWLDEKNLMPGVRWDDEIVKAIKNARFFLACLSKNSISKNGYVQRELRMALGELEKKASDFVYFIPVLIENIDIPNIKVGTINLTDYQAVKLFEEDGLEKLVNYLETEINTNNKISKYEPINLIENFIPEEKNKPELKHFSDYIKKLVDLKSNDNNIDEPNTIHLVTFDIKNRRAWYIIEVFGHRNKAFLKVMKSDLGMDLSDFGIIYERGWGKEPPESIKKIYREKFGLFKDE